MLEYYIGWHDPKHDAKLTLTQNLTLNLRYRSYYSGNKFITKTGLLSFCFLVCAADVSTAQLHEVFHHL